MNIDLRLGDCLEVMKTIEDNSIDLILCDLPYGTIDSAWDSVVPFEPLWEQYKRVIKDNGAIVLFGSEPFSTSLRASQIELFKYDWIWLKSTSAGFIHAKNMPLKRSENISVFSKASMGHKSLLKDNRMVYNPQNLTKVNKIHKRPKPFSDKKDGVIGARPSHTSQRDVEYEDYPTNILDFARGNNDNIHPTQKPVPLFEYLIKTYTNENETVLDNCMGSGTTAIACLNTKRNYIGFEMDKDYFDKATKRIKEHKDALDCNVGLFSEELHKQMSLF